MEDGQDSATSADVDKDVTLAASAGLARAWQQGSEEGGAEQQQAHSLFLVNIMHAWRAMQGDDGARSCM